MNQQTHYQNIQFLDVTLRDGGYRNGFHFDENIAKRLVKDLAASNMDYIEIGYRNGLSNRAIQVGPSGQSNYDYIYKLKTHCPSAQIGVMLHPTNVSPEDLYELKKLGINIIRVCLTAPTMAQNIETINACKTLGFITTANIIKVSRLSVNAVLKKVEMLESSQADVIYIADSFGNLIPEQVATYISAMKSISSKKIGFHAHNNLSLALSNTISAIQHGAEFIDSSICGMGFGTGNLPTEILAGYLYRIGLKNRLNTLKIFDLATLFSEKVPNSHKALHPLDISWGLNNFSSHFRKPIEEIAKEGGLSAYKMANLIAENNKIRPTKEEIEKFVHHSRLNYSLV